MRARDIEKENLVKKTAVEMIGKGGFEEFSVNKLAKACGISVATLYIYYKDKDDLITNLVVEQGKIMGAAMIKDFDPEASFEDGLRKQWENRFAYMLEHHHVSLFFERLRSSDYHEKFLAAFTEDIFQPFTRFMNNIVSRGEVRKMTFEVYWSVAFAPLYALIKFNNEGKGITGKPFKMTDEMLWEAFDVVVKGLKL